jgi:dihydrofolate reductase
MTNVNINIVYYVASSLDGFIATSDGAVEWLSSFGTSADDSGYQAFYATVDALLMGSRTYEQILGFGGWPYPGKPCWVFSHRDLPVSCSEVRLTRRTPLEVVSELQTHGLRRAWLVGGGQLAAAFRAQRLITDYIVTVFPVLLGDGLPMFGAAGAQEQLSLLSSRPLSNGIIQLSYDSKPLA